MRNDSYAFFFKMGCFHIVDYISDINFSTLEKIQCRGHLPEMSMTLFSRICSVLKSQQLMPAY